MNLQETPEPSATSKSTAAQFWRWGAGLGLGALFTWLSARSWPVDRLFGGSLTAGHDASGHAALVLEAAPGQATWSLSWSALAIYAVVLFIIHWLRVLRWKPLLDPYAHVSIRELNRVGAVGFAAVFLLPLRLGEFIRPLMLARPGPQRPPLAFGAGLGTIAVERILDGLLVSAILFAVLFEVHPATMARFPQVQIGAWAALGLFGTAMAGLVATLVAREFTLTWTRRIVGIVSKGLAEKVISLVTAFLDGLRVLQSPWHGVQFVGLTVVYWGMNGLGIWLFARGFGIEMPIVAAYAMMSCVVVGMMIPNSPGNVGSFWYFLLLPAGLYGIAPQAPRTIAFALALWLVQTVQTTVFGGWGLWADSRARRDQIGAISPP